MAVTLYSYAKLCDTNRLSQEIKNEEAIVVGEDHVETISNPATTNVYMKAELSSEEETELDALVDAHVNTPLPDSEPRRVTMGSVDSVLSREIISLSAFAVNTDYEVKATGFSGVAAYGTTTDIHHEITEDRYINGLEVLAEGAAMGDTVAFMVTDEDNALLYGAGFILKQFGFTWNIAPDTVSQGKILFNYLARIPAGFYVRARYVSVGGADVKVGVNLFLHKKVV